MIEILSPGPLSTIQDRGRWGQRALGVGSSGAADQGSHRLANRLVGNDPGAASIEVTLGGLSIRLLSPATIALTGARCAVSERPDIGWATPISLPAGATLSLGPPARGLRSYLAVRGGIDVPAVLGSRSTDTLSGLGPQRLVSGVRLGIGTAIQADPTEIPTDGLDTGPTTLASAETLPEGRTITTIEALPGPRLGLFAPGSWQQLLTTGWLVDPRSDRIGTRLLGPALQREQPDALPSEPTLPGAMQVPGNGQPIILGPDGPVTGGYPVIAVVATRSLDRLAQLRPGDELRLVNAARATVRSSAR